MQFDFDKKIDRRNTNCLKWDYRKDFFGAADILPLWVADLDFEAPPAVKAAIIDRAKHGAYGYSGYSKSYFAAICSWLNRRFNWGIDSDWIISTPGIVPAINFAIQTYTKPGDRILAQTPVYPPFLSSVKTNQRELVISELINKDNRYYMDFDHIETEFKIGVKMMLLCSPHNPVGRVWTKEELTSLGDLCLRHNVLLISDEIHADIVYSPHIHYPIASLSEEYADNTITMIAPSKTFNVAGLFNSAIIIPNQEIRKEYQHTIKKMGLYLGNIFGMLACEVAYNHGEDWLEAMLRYLKTTEIEARDYINTEIPMLKVSPLEGTFLLWLDFRKLGLSDDNLSDFLLNEAKVGLNSGHTFGQGGSGFMRMNIGCPRSFVFEALNRVRAALENETIGKKLC